MPDFEDVRHLLDKFFPHGAKREIWWVTEESLKNTCRACGICCAMIGFSYSISTMKMMFADEEGGPARDPDVQFIIDNMVTIPVEESVARGGDGGGENFVCCTKLTEGGLCSVHEDKPSFCRNHPVLGQSVLKECAFAGTDNYEKSPRGRAAAQLRRMSKVTITKDEEEK